MTMSDMELHRLLDSLDAGDLPLPKPASCDFCSHPSISFMYPCDEFDFAGEPKGGDWVACDRCHHLVEGEAWDQLVLVSYEATVARQANGKIPEEFRDSVMSAIRSLQSAFREHRRGHAVPI